VACFRRDKKCGRHQLANVRRCIRNNSAVRNGNVYKRIAYQLTSDDLVGWTSRVDEPALRGIEMRRSTAKTRENVGFLLIYARHIVATFETLLDLSLARLMGQHCLARWRLFNSVVCLRRLSASSVVCRRTLYSVTLPAGGGPPRMGGRAADTARRASTVTSRPGDILVNSALAFPVVLIS